MRSYLIALLVNSNCSICRCNFSDFRPNCMRCSLASSNCRCYDAFVRTDHDPNRVELENVPGYQNIQIHAGNYPKNFKGCFGAGTSHSTDYIGNSRNAAINCWRGIRYELRASASDAGNPCSAGARRMFEFR